MITINVTGLDSVLSKLQNMSESAQEKVQPALNDWADTVALNAKQLVSSNSSDEGNLLRSIFPVYGVGGASVVASASYAAYIEFGTRKFAASYVSSLPDTWQALANQAKGPAGGSFKEFVASLMAWCRRKGIDEKLAYPIAKKIIIQGIMPKPFLYPAVEKAYPQLIKDLKSVFK